MVSQCSMVQHDDVWYAMMFHGVMIFSGMV